MLREDNLGLGAQVGKGNAETFGLSMFSGLLGRLNGKDDGQIQKQQNAMRDVELRTYTGQKFGFMNFVSGGLLVGEKMEPPKGSNTKIEKCDVGSNAKKRKAGDDGDEDSVAAREPEKKRKRVVKDHADNKHVTDSSNASDDESSAKAEKRRRKERRKAEKAAKSSKSSSDHNEKARLKEEKRARKDERRKRKEDKRAKTATTEASQSQTSTQTSALPSESEGTATPPTATVFGGRQAVRRRYIQQKRMASMDPQALKEIFMLQAKAAATG